MRKATRFPAQIYVEGILKGDRNLLSKAITLVESSLPQDYDLAQEVISLCLPHTGGSYRIGITGVPGAGKSTFIETFGLHLVQQSLRIAVLAIDPTSGISGGSILGDKTRMQQLSTHPNAFVRPSPSAGNLGGVARKTREAMLLCEAAGFNVILIETVGVGQSEIAVGNMTDFFLLLLLPNAGDDLQGIKKGIMERASALLINKADGDYLPKARIAKALYSQALRLFPVPTSGWLPQVLLCSALQNTGIEEVWNLLLQYQKHTQNNGFWQQNRQQQNISWMHEHIQNRLWETFVQHSKIQSSLPLLESQIQAQIISPLKAADDLLKSFVGEKP